MEENLFFSKSEHKFQGIIHLFVAMIKIRCKMVSLKSEEKVKELLNFQIMEENGNIRNAKYIEEFTKTVTELKIPLEFFFC